MKGPLPGLSACIITRDEEDNIAGCIDSVRFCDEVLIVDSHSQDETRRIAASCGARVIERDWPGYAAQKQFALERARYDWVLCVDADERVPTALREEIETLRRTRLADCAGWRMPRRTWYLGAWIDHGTWYPDTCLRLIDRRRGRWVAHPDHDIHERVELDGAVGDLACDLEHFPYATIAEHLETIDHYTTLIAEGSAARGRRARLSDPFSHASWEWLRFYVLKRGFLDGWRGLLLACLHAHYVRMKYTKLRALAREPAHR